jgi:hypothetical protein
MNKLLNRSVIRQLRERPEQESKTLPNELIVQIKGGRYEVNLVEQIKKPIYWNDKKESIVRR